ncbi:hypothetical protein TCAL_10314 [Tigriopus californicus]|uniref:peptidylprolyl isomerase n=1 Tax=Tigriopus californicus TaxID=6832 RepID=A0A553NYI3_TIGCA|nr:AH receptor-interacting protein-like [Tigriopus californicus]TRY70478.1 hypothetical protein TCAL_10314 [Tigriopus californicus]|eukprot:TCALIF_10314-PA protein Name:"Similar to AIP AH receptor-interacting protein (Bos taurus)" AED:0.08 eAED:0.08 QI:126/1/1/1/1/1/5/193/375
MGQNEREASEAHQEAGSRSKAAPTGGGSPAHPTDGVKPIQKKILHAGRASPPSATAGAHSPPDFREGTKIIFHFVTKLCDLDGTVLDDSRDWPRPMELIIGKQFKLESWELCLQTMLVGEVASFTVQRQLTCNYPTVAKTLRDTFLPKRDKDGHLQATPKGGEQHQHMCGMMAMQMQGGLGYDDLNQLMKEPQSLEFIFEIIRIELPEDYQAETWQMKPDEKLGKVPELKEQGNRLFRQKKVKEASEKYGMAITLLEQLMLREKPNDEDWVKLRDAKIPLLLNFAQCRLSENDYYPVIEHCTEVLETDPDNVKARFRRAKAHVGAWNPDSAKEDFQRVIDLDPSIAITCKKELKKLEEMEKQKDEADKKKLQKLF